MIEQIVKDFSNEYLWHYECQKDTSPTPEQDINSGLCDLFAERVKAIYPQTIIHYDEDLDHVYCEIEGKFYDAENPKGVKSPQEMTFLGIIVDIEVSEVK